MASESDGGEFTQFLRLPTELQWHVWSLYCPELAFRPLHLFFTMGEKDGKVEDTESLEESTHTARRVLAVHRDSRQFALRALPDTLAFGGGFNLVRFKKERDLVRIALNDSKGRAEDAPGFRIIPGFSESVVNLCVSDGNILSTKWLKFYCCLPNLKFLYDQTMAYGREDIEQLPWCQSGFVHRVVDHVDDETCCWPDLLRHRNYARRHVKSDKFPVGVDVMSWAQWRAKKNDSPARCPCSLTEQNLDHLGNIKLWPLVWSTKLNVDGSLP